MKTAPQSAVSDLETFWKFSPLTAKLRPSAIREILKWTTRPGIISFAGGLPAPELFPVSKIQQCCDEVLSTASKDALQYSLTLGVPELREQLVEIEKHFGVHVTSKDIMVTSGAQQGLDLVVHALTTPGDVILTENPTYIGAIQIFQMHGVKIVPVPTDEEGMIPEALPELIARHRPRLLYVIPDFQNPTGVTLAASRRRTLLNCAEANNLPVIDDAPYSEIRFSGEPLPSLASMNREIVIGLRTFSKTIAPGFRVAWLTAAPPLIARLEILKQALDLHANTFSQYVISRFLAHDWYRGHLETIRADYRAKRAHMIERLTADMPTGISWTKPEGGLFLWVTLPEGIDATALLQRAVEQQVAYVPGEPFFANSEEQEKNPSWAPRNVLRLNFSNTNVAGITTGVERLASMFKKELGDSAS